MVTALRFGDTEADRDDVIPGRSGDVGPALVVVLNVESQLVAANPQGAVRQQWFVGSAIVIGDRLLDQDALTQQLDTYAFGSFAARGVENMRGKVSGGLWHVRTGDTVHQAKAGDVADLGQGGGALLMRLVGQAAFQAAQHEWRRLAADTDDEREAETGFVSGGHSFEVG